MTNGKKDILIITGRYLPGYKDGGPVRSIKNLTDFLGEEYNFKILTCDRDHGDTERYPNIKVNDWNTVGKAQVYYVEPGGFSRKIIVQLAALVDIVYVCGCFSDYSINALIANRLRKIKAPVVVASMGLFSPMAFRIKYFKKKTFTMIANALGLFCNVHWSVTSEMEMDELKQQINTKDSFIHIAEDLPRKVDTEQIAKRKASGHLNIVWISRIAEKKNLIQAVRILNSVRSDVLFTIYGPIHEEEYWAKCKVLLEELPSNIKWEYKGNVESEKVVEVLKKHHVFLFPTLGENYGHVIQEALSAGCPCILSDQTPWKDLENNNAGYVFTVDDEYRYVNAIELYARLNEQEFNEIVNFVHQYAIRNSNQKGKTTGYRDIFNLKRS